MDAILRAFSDLGKAPARPTEVRKGRTRSAETKAKMRAVWARRQAAGAGDTTENHIDAAEPVPKKKRVMSAQARGRISAA